MINLKDFDASTVPLKGSNLIEASAGTGKTYSIAILTLRLVLENKLSVKEILMVTFTKAAVAELEERIRLFIRQAYKVSIGETIKDSTITTLVQDAINQSNAEEVESILKEAVLFLDETSVLTIHSFCQQSLNEFAFETGQLFGADLLQDTSVLLDEQINSFWREKITNIPSELLKLLISSKFSRSSLMAIVKVHLEGKRYFIFDSTHDYEISEKEYSGYLSSIEEVKAQAATAFDEIIQQVIHDADSIKSLCETNRYTKKENLSAKVDDPESFLSFLWEKNKTAKYIGNTFPVLVEKLKDHDQLCKQLDVIVQEVIRKLNCWAITEATKGIEDQKRINNQLSYDDLIVNLHNAIVKRENPELVACLQQKYKAVFIDEFQDTDRMQYEIFEKAFGADTIVFYIGDPKQSIYAWRKADIFTYFKAKKSVGEVYGMNQNYRSSALFIQAMNKFFRPKEGFDTFHFPHASSAIEYINVDSPVPNTKGTLMLEDAIEVPISISEHPNKPSITKAVVGQVVELLSSNRYFIQEKESKRPVKPADIGVLVRGNREGKEIKTMFAKYGIPAVTIGDAKVLQTEEARYLFYLLEAFVDISMASINKALLSPFTGFSDLNILSLDVEQSISLFRNYKVVWEKDGIFAALNTFIHEFRVKQNLLSQHTEMGERSLTNLFQLIELLHKTQSIKNLSSLELIAWLKRGMEGDEQVGDEFEQRIESDEEAVKIVTIHKSKGLEYNIVLAPFLDLQSSGRSPSNPHSTCTYRDPQTGEYVLLEENQLSDEQRQEYSRQLEQENRRLIYVALTRAVYKCFLFKNTYYRNNSSLAHFVNACKDLESELIHFHEGIAVPDEYFYSKANQTHILNNKEPVRFKLLQPHWRKMSYSMLRADHEITYKNKSNGHKDPYEQFIFSQLTKGAKTGNMLHLILENIVFSYDGNWDYVIEKAVQQYAPNQAEIYTPMLKLMLDQVVQASIITGEEVFTLADVDTRHSIHELEFDFTVSPFQVDQISQLSDEKMEVKVKDYFEMEGVMNGKIDLFFEHKGKYYVLDWKSNYLGDTLEDYSSEGLALAMNENNYHLQYLIYTLATKKYLSSRLPTFDYESQFGGVIYLFLRGLRKGAETGVYFSKPSLEKIENLDALLAANIDQYNPTTPLGIPAF